MPHRKRSKPAPTRIEVLQILDRLIDWSEKKAESFVSNLEMNYGLSIDTASRQRLLLEVEELLTGKRESVGTENRDAQG